MLPLGVGVLILSCVVDVTSPRAGNPGIWEHSIAFLYSLGISSPLAPPKREIPAGIVEAELHQNSRACRDPSPVEAEKKQPKRAELINLFLNRRPALLTDREGGGINGLGNGDVPKKPQNPEAPEVKMIRFPHTPGFPAGVFHVGHRFFVMEFLGRAAGRRKSCQKTHGSPGG